MDLTALDLTRDAALLTAQLVDFASPSGQEKPLADAIETALRALPHLTVDRYGNNIVARTNLGRAERVILAGHIDTVPIADNVPSRLDEDGVLWGCGTSDMKSGVAVQLRIAQTVTEPNRDLTFVFYDNEEVAAHLNGLGHVAEAHPDWLEGDFAILLEGTDGEVEGGCQGTLRVILTTKGERAHSARAWMGSNAVHKAAPSSNASPRTSPASPSSTDSSSTRASTPCASRAASPPTSSPTPAPSPSTSATRPTAAPRRPRPSSGTSSCGCDIDDYVVDDHTGGARPGLDHPAAAAFMAAVGGKARPKFGWTDVSRFSALGVPAVNYGPGDPIFAHKRDEHVDTRKILAAEERLRSWLTA